MDAISKAELCRQDNIVSIGDHVKEPEFFFACFINCHGEEFLMEASNN